MRRTAQCEGLRKKQQWCVGVHVMPAILQARAHRSVKRAPERGGARGRVHAYAGQCRNKRECAGVSKDAQGCADCAGMRRECAGVCSNAQRCAGLGANAQSCARAGMRRNLQDRASLQDRSGLANNVQEPVRRNLQDCAKRFWARRDTRRRAHSKQECRDTSAGVRKSTLEARTAWARPQETFHKKPNPEVPGSLWILCLETLRSPK